MDLAQNNGNIVAIASEELEDIHYFENSPQGKYILIIDPLDGSGNLDINAPVASIFSVCRNPANGKPSKEQVLEVARDPIVAGICNYGLATTMALTFGEDVYGFTQDLESGVFFYKDKKLRMPMDWYYHVAPLVYYQEEGVVFDKGIFMGATYLSDWLESFGEGKKCIEIETMDQKRALYDSVHCMYMIVSMYYYSPKDLEDLTLTDFNRSDLGDMVYSIFSL